MDEILAGLAVALVIVLSPIWILPLIIKRLSFLGKREIKKLLKSLFIDETEHGQGPWTRREEL